VISTIPGGGENTAYIHLGRARRTRNCLFHAVALRASLLEARAFTTYPVLACINCGGMGARLAKAAVANIAMVSATDITALNVRMFASPYGCLAVSLQSTSC